MNQVGRAAELVQKANPEALLVIVVDAADNSIDAAAAAPGSSQSFVRDFLTLQVPPANVRFVVTGRTGRLESLQLPASFEPVALTGFTLDETAAHVVAHWPNTPTTWIEDFHQLSQGLPRVQAYAIEAAHGDRERALQYLRPQGKGLDDIFRGQIEDAIRKQANPALFSRFCAGLIALPRPIPTAALAATVGLSEQHCLDITADLSPGLTVKETLVSFADEDFEAFVRTHAADGLAAAQQAAATYLFDRRSHDSYAASHVATALYLAARPADVLGLTAPNETPLAISDPVQRRDVEIQRLQMAVKVCRDTGDTVESVLTLIRGARALKAETSINRLLNENADLATRYARDVAVRAILRDPARIEDHGAFLCALASAEARQGRHIEVRELRRQLRSWFGRRQDELEALRKENPHFEPQAWRIDPEDISELLEAVTLTETPPATIDLVMNWPRQGAFKASRMVAHRLAVRGELDTLRSISVVLTAKSPWWFVVGLPLAAVGDPIEANQLADCVHAITRRRLVSAQGLASIWSSSEPIAADFYDSVMQLCEIALWKGVAPQTVRPLLDILSHESLRRAGHTPLSQTTVLDISVRALALRLELDGKPLTYDTYVVHPPAEENTSPEQQSARRRDDDKEFITLLLPIYAARAKAFLNRLAPQDVATAINSAADAMQREKWRIERHHSAGLAFDRAARTLAQLIAIDGVDPAMLRAICLRLISSDLLATKASAIYALFALRHDQHSLLLQEIVARALEIKLLKWSARDRSDGLMALCRTLADISPDDARLLFNDAVAIAEEIDDESVHEVALIEPMAAKAAIALDASGRRRIAQRIVAVSGEMALRLDSPDAFPWSSIIRALVDLDVPVALAASAQWDDSERVQLGTTVPPLLRRALSNRTIDAATAASFLPLLVHAPEKLMCAIVQHAAGEPHVVELIARDELLMFGHGRREDVNNALSVTHAPSEPATFVAKLAATAAFLRQTATTSVAATRNEKTEVVPDPKYDLLSDVDWSGLRFDDGPSLADFIERELGRAQDSGGKLYARALLDGVQARVPLARQAAYLRALSQCHPNGVWWDDIATSLIACAAAWSSVPSVRTWCENELPSVVAAELPSFARYLSSGHAVLNSALPLMSTEHKIRDALLAGIEVHFEALDAATVYALAGLIGNACNAPQAASIIERHTAQMLDDLPQDVRPADLEPAIPDDVASAIGRFLYANLSDVDIHRRWRAAHATRRWIVNGGDLALPSLIANYSHTLEPWFRETSAPFHWHAARLWLVIAIGRAGVEVPVKVMPHVDWLKSVVADTGYPHLLLRTYAFNVIELVCSATGHALTRSDRAALTPFIRGAVKPKKLPSGQSYRTVHMRNQKGKRFPFDSMDTLPYWYEPAVRIFADITGEEFVAEAERWIVDQWGVSEFEHRWDTQPRRQKYGEGFDTMHRHGSLPQRERYHTHLEWHAMWCTIGSFLASRPLVRNSADDVDALDDKLESSMLTLPPRWLADLRDAKPLDAEWWFAPDDVSDTWLDDVHLGDALAFVNSAPNAEFLVVHAHAEAHSDKHTISKSVSSALVSPQTATDLMRALQSAESEQDYYLPDEDHQQEIDRLPFRLLGWRSTSHRDAAFDGEDPLRYGIGAPHARPGRRVSAVLKTSQTWNDQRLSWVTTSGYPAFSSYCWGDTRGDESERQRRHIMELRSSGSMLYADRKILQQILTALNMDLIAEVTITRRNFSYEGSSRGKEEDHKSQPHAFILLFRQTGEIETVEGRVGTWSPSG